MNSQYTNISLPGILEILQKSVGDKPILFLTNDTALETFFTYKGSIVEVFKKMIESSLHKKSDSEISEDIRKSIIAALKTGDWLVFSAGCNKFNFSEFFGKFFDTKTFFDNKTFHDESLLLKTGLLTEADNTDFYGNKGCFSVKESARVVYLIQCKEEEIDEILKLNSIDFEVYYVSV